jgi:hypothetical protein
LRLQQRLTARENQTRLQKAIIASLKGNVNSSVGECQQFQFLSAKVTFPPAGFPTVSLRALYKAAREKHSDAHSAK